MPETLGDDLERHAPLQHHGRRGVPEVMEPDPAYARRSHEPIEPLAHIVRMQRLAGHAGEHETVVVVAGAEREALLELTAARRAETVERDETIDGAALLDDIAVFLRRFVGFQSETQLTAVTLWTADTHVIEAFASTPRLSIRSPRKSQVRHASPLRCSDSSSTPLPVANITMPPLFRLIASEPVTLLHDEVDATFGPNARDHEDMRALLNAGHRRGADVVRCVGEGANLTVRRFPVFAPVAVAGIGSLPDTLESRCIVIALKKLRHDEHVEDFELDAIGHEGHDLHDAALNGVPRTSTGSASIALPASRACATGHGTNGDPSSASPRSPGIWRPRPNRRRRVTSGAQDDEQSRGVRLLGDIRAAFGDREAMFTAELLEMLNELEESPWSAWRKGQGLDARGLARLVKPFGVGPGDVHRGDGTRRGTTPRISRTHGTDISRPLPLPGVLSVRTVRTLSHKGKGHLGYPCRRGRSHG